MKKKIRIRRFRICEKHVMSSLLHAIIRLWSSSAFMSMHMRWSHASQLVPSYCPGRPNDKNPPEIYSFSLLVVISRFFSTQRLSFPFPVNLDFQNSSNCCTHKYDQSISRFLKNLILGGILLFGPIVRCRSRLLESSLTTTESCCREKTWFTYVVCIR